MKNILGEVVAAAGLKQLRAAETEKYPHVTFFFNGGIETPFPGEDRYLAVSPKEVPTYDKKPQMSAPDLAFEVVRRLENYDLVIINFANPDMVGHTGVVEAGIHAVETIDLAVRLVVEKMLALGGKLFITADHGNCELMRNPDGSPNTAHTTNLVHCIYVAADADEIHRARRHPGRRRADPARDAGPSAAGGNDGPEPAGEEAVTPSRSGELPAAEPKPYRDSGKNPKPIAREPRREHPTSAAIAEVAATAVGNTPLGSLHLPPSASPAIPARSVFSIA